MFATLNLRFSNFQETTLYIPNTWNWNVCLILYFKVLLTFFFLLNTIITKDI